MPNIIIKNYEHYNRSLPNWDTPKGKYIRDEKHYKSELKKHGMVSFENVKTSSPKLKDYALSNKAKEIIQQAKNSKDKNGKVRLEGRILDAMKEIGAINKKIPEYMGDPHKDLGKSKGGFY